MLNYCNASFGDLPPSSFKYHLFLVILNMTEIEVSDYIEDVEEDEDCSWQAVYRLYGCTLILS
jgi:hypothetical protein